MQSFTNLGYARREQCQCHRDHCHHWLVRSTGWHGNESSCFCFLDSVFWSWALWASARWIKGASQQVDFSCCIVAGVPCLRFDDRLRWWNRHRFSRNVDASWNLHCNHHRNFREPATLTTVDAYRSVNAAVRKAGLVTSRHILSYALQADGGIGNQRQAPELVVVLAEIVRGEDRRSAFH